MSSTRNRLRRLPAHLARDHEATCGCDNASLPRRDALGLDPLEQLILDLARCICEGYATGDIAAWDHAHQLAEERLGLVEGPTLAAQTFRLIRAVRLEREGGFGYMSLGCTRVAEDEQDLVSVLRSARTGSDTASKVAIERLVAGERSERTVLALRALWSLLARHAAVHTTANGHPHNDRARTLN